MFIKTTDISTNAIPMYPNGTATGSANTTAPTIVATTGSIVAIIDAVLEAMYFSPSVYSVYGITHDSSANSTAYPIEPISAVTVCHTGRISVTATDTTAANMNVYRVIVSGSYPLFSANRENIEYSA